MRQVDWRTLAATDLGRISRETDVAALQENLSNVTFCDVDQENFVNLDPNFLKLFKLSQLVRQGSSGRDFVTLLF